MGRAPDVNKRDDLRRGPSRRVLDRTVPRVLRGLQGMSAETRSGAGGRWRRTPLSFPSVVAPRAGLVEAHRRIGVVGYETFESSTSKVLKGVNDVATAAGYVLDIGTVDPLGDVDEITRRLDAINGSDAAGLLATSPTANVRQALERSVFRMPVFLDVNGDVDHARPALRHEHLGSARDGSSACTGSPPRSPMWPAPPDGTAHRTGSTSIVRRSPEATSTRRGWCGRLVERSPATRPPQLLFGTGITAIFVANDRMALGVLRALTERGIRCRRTSAWQESTTFPKPHTSDPPLTSVHIDFAEGGRVAARSLIRLIESPGTSLPEYPVSALIARSSTAPIA